MSLASQISAVTAQAILNAVSAANTAAATSAWTQIAEYEGEVAVLISVGVITGTIDFTFHTATANDGTGSAALTPLEGALAQVTTSNDDAVYVARFPASQLKGYLRVTGTIVTGPAPISYTLYGRKKTV